VERREAQHLFVTCCATFLASTYGGSCSTFSLEGGGNEGLVIAGSEAVSPLSAVCGKFVPPDVSAMGSVGFWKKPWERRWPIFLMP
jgi:hypothetical protein